MIMKKPAPEFTALSDEDADVSDTPDPSLDVTNDPADPVVFGIPKEDFCISFRECLINFREGKSFVPDAGLANYLMDNNLPVLWGAK